MSPCAVVPLFWRAVLRGNEYAIYHAARAARLSGYADTLITALHLQIAEDLVAGRGSRVSRKQLALGVLLRTTGSEP